MHFLIIRFSAMGDVALLAPLLAQCKKQYPDLQISVLSRPFYKPFFALMPGVNFIGIDVDKQYSGAKGMYRLFSQLKQAYDFDGILDMHDSIRSRIISMLFRLSGKTVCRIEKGRREKRALLKKGWKNSEALPHVTRRYAEVFRLAGYPIDFPLQPIQTNTPFQWSKLSDLTLTESSLHIGVAPFAKHDSKICDLEKIISAMKEIKSNHPNAHFFLYGAGALELEGLKKIKSEVPTSTIVNGLLNLGEELESMKALDLMICMDSANMHMAAMMGCKVLSIWIGTHPYAGFSPLFNEQYMLQSEYQHRPCTIYGKIKTEKQRNCVKQAQKALHTEGIIALANRMLANK